MTPEKLAQLLLEQAEIKALADEQRRRHAVEYGLSPRTVKTVIWISRPQPNNRKTRKRRKLADMQRSKRDVLFTHYGRYLAGARDQQATEAYFGLKGLQQ